MGWNAGHVAGIVDHYCPAALPLSVMALLMMVFDIWVKDFGTVTAATQ
jgi:hypothetical protein